MHRVGARPLWLGHAGDARNLPGLHALGIVALVDLAREEPPATLTRDLAYFRFPIVDGPENPRWLLREAVESIARLVRERIPTLVACGAGMSRSPAITAAALARAEDRRIEDCLAEIAKGRAGDVSPALLREIVLVT